MRRRVQRVPHRTGRWHRAGRGRAFGAKQTLLANSAGGVLVGFVGRQRRGEACMVGGSPDDGRAGASVHFFAPAQTASS